MALSRIKTWIAEILYASDLNAEINNILNNALSLISPLTGNLDAGSNRITTLGAPTALTDAMRSRDQIHNLPIYYTTTGTQPTYILTPSPAITAYAAGQGFLVYIHSTNAGGAATLNVGGLGAKAIVSRTNRAMAVNDLLLDAIYYMVYDGTSFRVQSLVYYSSTFTPVLTPAGGTITNTTQVGVVKVVEDVVSIFILGGISGTGTPTGALTITGLPFASKNTANNHYTFAFGHAPGVTQSLFSTYTGFKVSVSLAENSSTLLFKSLADANGQAGDLATSVFNGTAAYAISGSYVRT